MTNHHSQPDLELFDLASESLGGAVLWANDEFFAEKENLLREAEPVWKEDVYTDRGKWMDGWETRRRRTEGHDLCIIRLGVPGCIRQVVVNTAFFRGNYPEACSLEGCVAGEATPVTELADDECEWFEILGRSKLKGDTLNIFEVEDRRRFTHLRFHIYPDGGVARLRVLGEVVPDPTRLRHPVIDLVGALNGGRTLQQSDMFFGQSQNLLKPGRGVNMGDGWETKRRRGPGHDWVLLRLAGEGVVERVEVDTLHFKGNYPDRYSLELYRDEPTRPQVPDGTAVVEEHSLQAHTRHITEISGASPAQWAVFRIYPDGGVSRLRLWGHLTDRGHQTIGLRWINSLTRSAANEGFLACCGSTAWARQMTAAVPFASTEALLETAADTWNSLDEPDKFEAFAAHPRIGGKAEEARANEKSKSWSSDEQSAVAESGQSEREELAELNDRYYDKFGFIFIICASGRSPEEILEALRVRIENDLPTELENAGREQARITELRLHRWLVGF